MNHADEIKAVKELGERIGYGNLMHIASALWDRDLRRTMKDNEFNDGCFVPTCFCFVKDKFRNMTMSEHLQEYNRVVTVLDM